jgi:hypothetical protein
VAYTEFTVRSGGSNLYAGTLDGSAEAATTPLVTYTNGGWNSGTGVFTPASGDPSAAGVAVGNFVSVYADGASAPAVFVGRVTAVSSTTITVSTTAKSGTAPTTSATGRTLVVGGAWAGPSGTSGFPLTFVAGTLTDSSGNVPRVNYKNDQTYSLTAAVTSSVVGPVYHQGYTSTFGDLGRATVDGGTSGSGYTPVTLSGSYIYLKDFILQNNGNSSNTTWLAVSGVACLFERVTVCNCRGSGVNATGSQAVFIECEAYACNASNASSRGGFRAGADQTTFLRCVARDNTGSNGIGFLVSATGGATCVDCVADTNGSHGFSYAFGNGGAFAGCSSYGNGGAGLSVSVAATVLAESCVFANNTTYGIVVSAGYVRALNCAFRSNTSGETSGIVDATGSVTLTAAPFTDAANRDFSLNNTAGGGAACRGTGRGTFPPSDPTVGYPDIGAAQSQSSGSGNTGLLLGGLGQTGMGAF